MLCDLAEGICCRVYFLRSQSPKSCMGSAEWTKIRQKLEKSFPDITEAQKVHGYDTLKAGAGAVVSELQSIYDIFVDAADFNDAALELMNELTTEIFAFNVMMHQQHFCCCC